MKISLAIRIGLSVVLLCMTNTAESKVQVADAHSLPADPIPCPGQCYCAKRLLICSGANITDILNVTIDFQRLEHLEYSNMTLDALPEELKFMSDCKTLNLSGNHIEHFDNDSMLNLWNLEELILSSNSIYNISMIHPDTLLYNNKYIKLLNLSNNPLTNLEGHAHSIFRSDSLEVLDLSHCQIESVVGSRVLSELKKLTYLNLSNNPLVRFDGVASNTLRILNLKGGQLRYLSQSSMRNLKNLEVLDVSFNEELYIMVGIQTTSLETIDAGTCSVRSPNIHGMSGLKSAFFNGNRIRRLDAYQFINNSNLEFLDLSQNIVETVDPQAFRGLTSLVSLDLSSNMIKSIAWEPLTVAMPSLQELRLSHNMISHVSPLVSKTLRRLDFRHCWITSVPGGAFAQLDGLAELVLSNNPLRTVLPDSFNSSRLTALDLSFCRLSHLSALEFAHTPNLTDLNLAGNRLVTIKNGTFAKCPKLRSVYLDDNPWRCDCYSLNFAYMAFLANKTTRLALLDRPPKCLTPDNVTGMPWHVACRNALSYTRDNRKNFSMAIGVILILCVSGLTAIFMAVHENIKTRRAMRRRRQLDEYGNPSRGGLGTGADEYFDEYAAAAESARKLSQLPSYDEAIMLPRPPEMRRAKRHSCTQTDDDEPADADSHLRPAATANGHHHHHHHHHHHRRSAAADGSGGSGSSGSSGGSGGGGGGGGGGGAGDALSGLDIYDVSGRGADDWFLSPKPRPPSLPPPGLRVTHL